MNIKEAYNIVKNKEKLTEGTEHGLFKTTIPKNGNIKNTNVQVNEFAGPGSPDEKSKFIQITQGTNFVQFKKEDVDQLIKILQKIK